MSRIRGTLILKRKKRFYKVVAVKRTEGKWWSFECRDLKTKQGSSFRYEMLGVLEAMDAAHSVMKDPKDIMLIDLDNQGKWKIIPLRFCAHKEFYPLSPVNNNDDAIVPSQVALMIQEEILTRRLFHKA